MNTRPPEPIELLAKILHEQKDAKGEKAEKLNKAKEIILKLKHEEIRVLEEFVVILELSGRWKYPVKGFKKSIDEAKKALENCLQMLKINNKYNDKKDNDQKDNQEYKLTAVNKINSVNLLQLFVMQILYYSRTSGAPNPEELAKDAENFQRAIEVITTFQNLQANAIKALQELNEPCLEPVIKELEKNRNKIHLDIFEEECDHSALTKYLRQQDEERVLLLVNARANVNIRGKGYFSTPLMTAIKMDSPTIILKTLIENKADVDFRDNQGRTAFMNSCRNPAVAKLLVENKANVDLRDNQGNTALLQHCYSLEVAKFVIKCKANVDLRDDKGKTPLMQCFFNLEFAKLLLESKADVDSRDDKGRTPLMNNCDNTCNNTFSKLLVESKTDVNAQDNEGKTALMYSCHNPEVARLLLENKATVDMKDNQGRTALMYRCNNPEVAKLLIAYKAKINVTDNEGRTALHYCSDPLILEWLLAEGSNVNLKDNQGKTTLMTSCTQFNVETAMYLVSVGAGVNYYCWQPVPGQHDPILFSPLTCALEGFHNNQWGNSGQAIINCLLSAGAIITHPILITGYTLRPQDGSKISLLFYRVNRDPFHQVYKLNASITLRDQQKVLHENKDLNPVRQIKRLDKKYLEDLQKDIEDVVVNVCKNREFLDFTKSVNPTLLQQALPSGFSLYVIPLIVQYAYQPGPSDPGLPYLADQLKYLLLAALPSYFHADLIPLIIQYADEPKCISYYPDTPDAWMCLFTGVDKTESERKAANDAKMEGQGNAVVPVMAVQK